MKINVKIFLSLLLTIAINSSCSTKNKVTENTNANIKVQLSCIAFYNQENLFDTIDNDNVNDAEYLPNGPVKWGTMKYNAKLQHMSYAISQIGLDNSPVVAIIGVSEIENQGVLEDLIKQPY